MNLKALHDEVAAILDQDRSFNVSVEVWDHRRDGSVSIEVAIWDGRTHFTGPTPDAALQQLKMAYGLSTSSMIPSHVIMPETIKVASPTPGSTPDPVEF